MVCPKLGELYKYMMEQNIIALVMRIQSWDIAIGFDGYLLYYPSDMLMSYLHVDGEKLHLWT